MFVCNRCESSFSPTRAVTTSICPRCSGKDGVRSLLTFAPFSTQLPEADDAPRNAVRAARDEGDALEAMAKT